MVSSHALRYLVKRLGVGVFIVWAVTFLVFGLLQIAPGSPADILLAGGVVTEEMRQTVIQQYNLNEPWHVQYLLWLKDVLTGDLGYSFAQQRPVAALIAERWAITAQIVTLSMVLATLLSIPTGIVAGYKHGSRLDRVLTVLAIVGVSVPVFVSGVLAILVFSFHLNVLPSSGAGSGVVGRLTHLFVPSLLLGGTIGALMFRMMRSGMRDVLEKDYMETCVAMGLPTRRIVLKHATINALAPVLTVSGLWIGFLIVYAMVVEYVFGMGGLGRLIIHAVQAQDAPVVLAGTIITAVVFVVSNIVVDFLYTKIDPRITIGGQT
ncbi:peptide/nickel transport system permease protein [Haloplanus vescus]|uniref:Peptide/nickel transport system permease protein n=1 Tax=Haloplanus vescus TaxID=555874 RepID=A0A1H3WDY5_9EURY|nr:ABC transporter permease [Haloplanus vescus]SDZ84458.1 peptide/nickel transport system permease protein [Haloplanus vescus]